MKGACGVRYEFDDKRCGGWSHFFVSSIRETNQCEWSIQKIYIDINLSSINLWLVVSFIYINYTYY